jgi:glycosyltransferase involved in cell wall biosynthesis
MRVLYVNQTSQASGAERSLLALLKGLAGEVDLLVACPEGELAEELGRRGIEQVPIRGTQVSFRLHPLHTSRGLLEIAQSSLQVRRLVARHRPDLVHANTTRAALLALLARDRGGPPTIAHIRDRARPGRFTAFVLGVVARRADVVLANSAYVAEQFDELRPRGQVRVIHNPVDLAQFDPTVADGPAVRRELDLAGDTVVLSVVGQLTSLKGQDEAIRVAAGLAAAGCDVVLLVVGSAKFASAGTQLDNVGFERRLHELTDELGARERVRFLGERTDIPAVLAATDLMLMPSRREGFGRVAVEAMAMGVPVAAADVGGPTEIVRHGRDGLLLPLGEPQAWVAELEPLVRDGQRRREMGGEAVARARDFSLARHVAAMRALYEELVPAGRAG